MSENLQNKIITFSSSKLMETESRVCKHDIYTFAEVQVHKQYKWVF